MKAKTTKRALLMSVLSLMLCIAMLIGTTYAWFTDSVTTGVGSIQSGTLSIDLVDESGASLEDGTLYFRDANGETDILWEPGARFELDSFKIVNTGNLHLKYKVELTAFSGDTELLDVIDLTVNDQDWDSFWAAQSDVPLAPGASVTVSAVGKMSEEAGNEYMGKTLNAVQISVAAAQLAKESDSIDHTYDEDAEYPVIVNTAAELKEALVSGEDVKLDTDVTLNDEPIAIPANSEAVIDLNGNDLLGVATNSGTSNMIKVPSTSTLTLKNGTVSSVATKPDTEWGGEGQPAYPGYASNTIRCEGTLIIDGATVENKTGRGGASYAIDCYAGANLIINSGKVIQSGGDVAIRMFANSTTKATNVTINGGEISGYRAVWVQLPGSKAEDAPIANLSVNGGILTSTDTVYNDAIYTYSFGNSFDNTTVTITGGTFNGNVSFCGGKKIGTQTNVITGGTFNGYLGTYISGTWEDIAKP